MGPASFVRMLVLAIAAADTPIEPPFPSPDLPEPIYTRQTLFSIPFQVDTAGDPARQPAEIQLHVSTDLGHTWQTFMSVEPARSQFLFRAAGEGRYWFQVRTLDQSGKIRPEPTDRPGLCVVVDTTPPQLDLEAWQGEAGQITAKWQLTEPHLHADGLTIQYRPHSGEPWQTVAMDPQTAREPEFTRRGQVTWVPSLSGHTLEIRAEAADAAGNRVVNHAHVTLSADPVATATPKAAPPGQPENTPWENPIAAKSHPPIHHQFVPDSERALNDRVAPPQPQMINTSQLELGYEVDRAGAGAIDRVELWGTRDGGQTWLNLGLDADKQSPVTARVDGEGVWGFLITIRDERGDGGGPPRPGDTPDVLVGVDLTEPVARIVSTEPTTPNHQGPIQIRWEAADAALVERPISLYCRATPGGPWIPVAADLENTGEYEWWRGPQTPPPISFRLEVRDTAGNVGVFETPEAPAPNRREPVARIHDVRPAGKINLPAASASGS